MPQRRVLRRSAAPAPWVQRSRGGLPATSWARLACACACAREAAPAASAHGPRFLLSAYGAPGAPAADPSAGDKVAYAWTACDAARRSLTAAVTRDPPTHGFEVSPRRRDHRADQFDLALRDRSSSIWPSTGSAELSMLRNANLCAALPNWIIVTAVSPGACRPTSLYPFLGNGRALSAAWMPMLISARAVLLRG
jgi:hypothetical protein